MNRKNKIQTMHNKRQKRIRAKLKNSGKEAYVSKADRVKSETENSEISSDTTHDESAE